MTPEERVMTDSEAKTNMTNTGLEKRRPDNEEELPITLTRYIRTVRRLVSGSRTAEEAPPCDSPKLC